VSGFVALEGRNSLGAQEGDTGKLQKIELAKSSIKVKQTPTGTGPGKEKMESKAEYLVEVPATHTLIARRGVVLTWNPIHHGGCDLKDISLHIYDNAKIWFYANGKSREAHGDSWELRFTITAPSYTWTSPNTATTATNEHYTIPIGNTWKYISIDLSSGTFQKFDVSKIDHITGATITHY
jgi:hypothetical protein